MELAVLIPSRNERWLKNTVEDVLAASQPTTEVIVVLDGAWPVEPLHQDARVSLLYLPESRGQRAAVNLAARITTAKYIMKLDAHCRVAEGFDTELIRTAKQLGREVTQVPAQLNLHVHDWQCKGCGNKTYQGPTPTSCVNCPGTEFERVLVWKPRLRRRTEFWRFDRALHFQYWGAFKRRPEAAKEIADTMSCLGACWFLSKEWFWELGGLDEGHGSWGQMGTEIACKSWLSGGRMVVNKRTWFAHLFRTQGGDFGAPYPLSQRSVEAARAHSRELWLKDGWSKTKRPLSWLIEKFAPVPDWPSVSKGIVYYTDNRLEQSILVAVQRRLEATGLPIVAASLRPLNGFKAQPVVLEAERGILTMFRQILAGLEASTADVVFFAEHDVLYHPSHFDFTPPRADVVFYNENIWKVDAKTGKAIHYICRQTSGLCAYRELLLEHYRKRVALVEEHGFSRRIGFEPGTHGRAERVDDLRSEGWWSEYPNIDIRHEHNLTPSRWQQNQFRNLRSCRGWMEADEVPGWGKAKGRFKAFLEDK